MAWHVGKRSLPVLHWRDPVAPPDSDLSLWVLWCKAISSLDKRSPTFDPDRWAYRMLPRRSRWLLRVIPFFPRLHHDNIELRTIFLERALSSELERLGPETPVRLVTVGAGYDPRSLRLLSQNKVAEAWELDLPSVIQAKQNMLQRLDLGKESTRFEMVAVDLSDVDRLQRVLSDIMSGASMPTILVSEAVFIYVDRDVPEQMLRIVRQLAQTVDVSASFCFADLLYKVDKGDRYDAERYFDDCGWELVDWTPKPGLARHMGVARLR